MSKVYSLLPKLTVNEQFINEFISAQTPEEMRLHSSKAASIRVLRINLT
jgi:hypothetical protein